MSYIDVINETKKYKLGDSDIVVNDNINIEIDEGELVVILGASGAGKTTFLNILGGIDTPTRGTVIIGGERISSYNNKQLTNFRKKDVGFIFQFYNLIQNLTVRENIEIVSELIKSKVNIDDVLEQVGLKEKANNFPSQLSGGEQQRVSIARAIVKNPKILLCDEPTGALDQKNGKLVLKILQEMNQKNRTTIVIITHNPDIAKMANKVIYINDGKVDKIIINSNPKMI